VTYRTPPTGPLLVACMYKRLVGFDRLTGAHAWVYEADYTLKRAVVAGDRVFAGGADGVVSLHYPTGQLVWKAPSPIATDTFLVDGDVLFVASAGEIAAFSTADGRLLWHDPLRGWGQAGVGFATPTGVAHYDQA
jgi:outer membrane protein assembly factor BamB